MTEEVPKMDLRSKDISDEQRQELKQLFPEVFTEDRIDFDKLKNILSDEVETEKERYGLSWAGKSDCIKVAQEQTSATLKPCRKESIDFDDTENLFIEGDNLEVLKLLQRSYSEKIKMIYIDPPYNTGNDFVYNDKFGEELQNYLRLTGQLDEKGSKLSTNTEATGRYHSNWLSMMYPRLVLAKNLLQKNGVIFISIGQDEIHNLLQICNEIFGEENRVGIISRIMKSGGNQGTFFSKNIDYVLVFAKDIGMLDEFREELGEDLIKKVYTQVETEGIKKGEKYRAMGLYQPGLEERVNQRFWIKCPDNELVIPEGETIPLRKVEGEKVIPKPGEGVWRWTYERYVEEQNKGNILFKKTNSSPLINQYGNKSKWNIYTKIWLNDRTDEGKIPVDLITKYENRHSSAELKSLEIPFDFAKPVGLIKYLAGMSKTYGDNIILDFFAGSATTAHAIFELNREDSSKRKFICVQLPEPTTEDSEAFKLGYKNIAEIGKERIRRVIKKIRDESKQQKIESKKQDLGFKVFKLDKSNFKVWDMSSQDSVQSKLSEHVETVEKGSSTEDLLYELILKDGLELTEEIKTLSLSGKKVHSIMDNTMLVCLEKEITLELVKEMAKLKPSRIICLDEGFRQNDQLKTNAVKIFKQANDQVVFRTV